MESPARIRRNIVVVRSRDIGWSHTLRISGSIQPHAIKITLRGILRRRSEIKPAALLVGAHRTHYIEISVRDQLYAAAVARNQVSVPPAVPFAEPEKIRSVMQPGDFRHHVHPGCVLILKNRSDCSTGAIGD